MTENTRIKISLDQVSYEVEGTEEFVTKELAWFKEEVMGKVDWRTPTTPPGSRPPLPIGKEPVFKEFLKKKNPGNDMEAAAVLAYYLEKWKGIDVIDGNLISEWFTKGGRKPPKSPGQTLADAKNRKGYFNKTPGAGKYTLSNTGRYLVETELPRTE